MPKGFPILACKGCQKPALDRKDLSRTGLCPDCSEAIQKTVLKQISTHDGPWFKYWRQRMAASVGGVLLDDVQVGD